jgi:hypothetical protein
MTVFRFAYAATRFLADNWRIIAAGRKSCNGGFHQTMSRTAMPETSAGRKSLPSQRRVI